jgi:hypothetical protein
MVNYPKPFSGFVCKWPLVGCQMVSFPTKKSQFLNILGGLKMEHFAIVRSHSVHFVHSYLEYVMALWYIFWSFGIFFPVWYFVPRKIWQSCVTSLIEDGSR